MKNNKSGFWAEKLNIHKYKKSTLVLKDDDVAFHYKLLVENLYFDPILMSHEEFMTRGMEGKKIAEIKYFNGRLKC